MSTSVAAQPGIVLRDGTTLEVRPIEPCDGTALERFHGHLSSETTRLRYFSPHPTLSPGEVAHLATVDHRDREALVAWADGEIVGVARFERLDDPTTAEVAFVVADRWQGRGIATALLEVLARRAVDEGISRFVADALCDNRPMLDVFQRSRFGARQTTRAGVTHVSMSLSGDGRRAPGPDSLPGHAVAALAGTTMAG